MSRPLRIQINELAKAQVRAAEEWWRFNRPKAPNAIREEFERAASLIAFQPEVGTRARNVTLPGVRRLRLDRVRYYLYYRVIADPEQVGILAFWHASRGSSPEL